MTEASGLASLDPAIAKIAMDAIDLSLTYFNPDAVKDPAMSSKQCGLVALWFESMPALKAWCPDGWQGIREKVTHFHELASSCLMLDQRGTISLEAPGWSKNSMVAFADCYKDALKHLSASAASSYPEVQQLVADCANLTAIRIDPSMCLGSVFRSTRLG